MCVQSSAAVMAITMILCSSGALPIYQGIALVMGENIGTTVTSNLAALTASTQARRAAFAHMFFNIFGVCWILIVFHPFIDFVCSLVGFDVEMTRESAGQAAFLANAAKLSVVLAAFHTCFNLANTGILIWFIPQIEKIVCRVIKSKKTSEESEKEPLRLQYIGGGLMQTPEIAVLQAQKEVAVYAERIHRMFGMVKSLLEETNDDNFVKTFSRIEKYESISDNMEIEIARYLERVGDEHISVETKSKIRSMMRQISEIESIGDACYNLSRTLNRRQQSNKSFNKELMDAIREMMALVEEALTLMTKVVSGPIEQQSINDSYRLENSINSLRDRLKTENISAINDQRYDYAIGTMFSDIIRECEKLGDYIVNVVQARFGK